MVCMQRGKEVEGTYMILFIKVTRRTLAGSYILDSCNHHGIDEAFRLLYHTAHIINPVVRFN